MSASLSLSVQTTPTGPATPSNLAGYRLRMTATGTGMPSQVFIFQAPTATTSVSGPADTFYSVASVGQLAAVPPAAPASGSPFYRVATLDLVFESEDALQAGRDSIEFMLGRLVHAQNAFAASAAPVTVQFN